MKKIMSLMLGLSLVLGTAAFAADEKPAGEKKTEKKVMKHKKHHAKKKMEKKMDEKKADEAAPAAQ